MTSTNFYTSKDPDYVRSSKVSKTLLTLQKEGVSIPILMPVAHEFARRSNSEGLVEGTPATLQVQAKLARAGESYGGSSHSAAILLSNWIAGRALGIDVDPLGWFPISFAGDPFTTNGQNQYYVEYLTDRNAGTPKACLLQLLKNIAPAGSMLLACMMAAPKVEDLLVDVYGNRLGYNWLRSVSYELSQEIYLTTVAEYLQSFGWKPKEGRDRARFLYPAFYSEVTPELSHVRQFLSVNENFRNLPEQWQLDIAAASLLSRTVVTHSVSRAWYQWAGDPGGSRQVGLSGLSMYSLLDSAVVYAASPLPEVWNRISELFAADIAAQLFEGYTGVQDFYNKVVAAVNQEDGASIQRFKTDYEARFDLTIGTSQLEDIAYSDSGRIFYGR